MSFAFLFTYLNKLLILMVIIFLYSTKYSTLSLVRYSVFKRPLYMNLRTFKSLLVPLVSSKFINDVGRGDRSKSIKL